MTSPSIDATTTGTPGLKVGLIGSGKMGLQHLKAISQIQGAIVVGVADPLVSEEAVRSLLPPSARLVADSTQLIGEVQPDVIHIVTPPEAHTRLALQALSAGCHVYIEKPFAPTAEEAKSILTLAAEKGLRVCAGHQCLFEPPALASMEMLPDVGRIVHVESFFSFRMVRRTITAVDQCKDILPHAVYTLLQQLRFGEEHDAPPIEIVGVDAKASGDLYALLRVGQRTGILEVTLSGRPIEQYQHIVGTAGSLRADYVTGSVTRLLGPGTGLGVLFTPYRRAFQSISGATRGFAKLLVRRDRSYPGLRKIIERFYASITAGAPDPVSPRSILETVEVCERLGSDLDQVQAESELAAEESLGAAESCLRRCSAYPVVLVTGGTGFLGREAAMEIRKAGFRTRVIARHVPPASQRVPGVEYVAGDLANGTPAAALHDVDAIVHCAAETAGGKAEHGRNSIAAARNLMVAAANAGVRRVIHVSSLAVLVPSGNRRKPLDEQTAVDVGNISRGPYVWGKAESEIEMRRLAAEAGIGLRVIRPGPLVDYRDFQAPGRLGREIGPLFVAVGSRKAQLSVCDVRTAACVIRSYLEDFDTAPPLLNLVESPSPTRTELVDRLLARRRDLRVCWIPALALKLANGPAKLAQRLILGIDEPADIAAAFSSERYKTDLAAVVIAKAGSGTISQRPQDH